MGCLEENVVQAFARGQLPAEALRQVEAHARECAECLELLRAALTLSGLDETGVTVQFGPTPARRAARRAPLAKGTSIGRYTVLELVGRGGMGEVYSAYDPGLDRRVAVKLLHGEGGAIDPRGQERLLREGQAIAKLSHPNVVVVHDVGTIGDQVFVAMEYVDGWTLASWLTERQRTWPEILGVFIKAGRGLAAAHRAGFVHRDFKPQNVMVGRDGAVRVMDFGLARRIDRDDAKDDAGRAPLDADARAQTLTQTDVLVGTPYYMAPEQVAREATDARSDQFSFCVALHWALTGTHPFGGTTPSTEAMKSAPPAKMPSAAGGAPPWLVRILRRGLSQSPDARWPAMDDLLAVLSRDRSRRRRRAVFAGATLLLVGGSLAFGMGASRFVVDRPTSCSDGRDALLRVWEPFGVAAPHPHREALHVAIVRSAGSEASRIWERVSSLLDQRTSEWSAAYRDSCEATNLRHEQSAELMDLRMECLKDSLHATEALTLLLAQGDPRVVLHAPEAVGALEGLHRCSDPSQLRLGPPPPDLRIRRRVEELRRRLREADALFDVTQYRRAAQVAAEVLSAATSERLGYCPLEAEAMVVQGDSELSLDLTLGQTTVKSALERAEGCGHDRVVARAATELVWAYAFEPNVAQDFAGLARGAIARLGGDSRLEGWLANNSSVVFNQQGRSREAREAAERAVRIKEQSLGPDHLDTAISLSNEGIALVDGGQPAEALSVFDRVLQIEAPWVGRTSLVFLHTQADRAEALGKLGRYAEAKEEFEKVISDMDSGAEVDDRDVARTLTSLGEVLILIGRPAQAAPRLERALHLQDHDTPFEIAKTKFALARARTATAPGDRVAIELAAQAETTYATSPYFERQHLEVTAWLLAHRPPEHRRQTHRTLSL